MIENNTPRISIFYCSNSIDREHITNYISEFGLKEIKAISLPCSGKINIPYMVKTFETGVDGVVILTCEFNECRHIEGNKRALKRAYSVNALLDEIGVGSDRIAVLENKRGGIETTVNQLKDFLTRLKRMPIGKHK